MIYKFPTNSTIDSALKGESGSSIESYIDSNLPSGKVGKLVELAIEIQTGTNITPFINTKVPIGQRDKLLEICFTLEDLFFVCALASSSRSSGQLIDLAEIADYVNGIKHDGAEIIPLYVVPDFNQINNVVDNSKIFKNINLWTVQRTTLCGTLNSWRS
jgi:hypothetical protein